MCSFLQQFICKVTFDICLSLVNKQQRKILEREQQFRNHVPYLFLFELTARFIGGLSKIPVMQLNHCCCKFVNFNLKSKLISTLIALEFSRMMKTNKSRKFVNMTQAVISHQCSPRKKKKHDRKKEKKSHSLQCLSNKFTHFHFKLSLSNDIYKLPFIQV